MRARPTLPSGHGELLTRPDVRDWPALALSNRETAESWSFDIGGMSARALRALARCEALERGTAYCDRIGIAHAVPLPADEPLIVTGHQPELYHPGVWIKNFLMQSCAREVHGNALDVVVDTDGFDTIGISAPCFTPEVGRCRQYLALGASDSAFVLNQPPSQPEIDAFRAGGEQMLASLSAPAIQRHFSAFCDCLTAVRPRVRTLSEFVTAGRRCYEAAAGTDYLELPVSELGSGFAHFSAAIALDAARFVRAYNDELAEYRELTNTRSPAQPFPDLEQSGEAFELPLWYLSDRRRVPVWSRPRADGGADLLAEGEIVASLPADCAEAVDVLSDCDGRVAPKAVALTLYMRLFVADLFIHGVGGGRYDRVTDGVARRYFGVEPPPFVVASLTMYLPLGAHVVSEEEVSSAKERLNRLEHNPDAVLGEVDFDSAHEREQAWSLAAEKRRLVEAIAEPGADKKALGLRIRTVNADLVALLEPVREAFERELASLETQREASEILTDRTYPFCLWSPLEVADKVW